MTLARPLHWIGISTLCLFAGCGQPSSAPPAPPPTPAPQTNAVAPAAPLAPLTRQYHLNHAQPRLRTVKLWLGPEEITAEVAVTIPEIATGMMFRETMAENEGMLFVFRQPQRTSFYMKNTRLPLSAAYIDPEGTILEIVDLHPFNESPVPSRSEDVQYVLEMNQGWFNRHQIAPGTVIRAERGTLRETFVQTP